MHKTKKLIENWEKSISIVPIISIKTNTNCNIKCNVWDIWTGKIINCIQNNIVQELKWFDLNEGNKNKSVYF